VCDLQTDFAAPPPTPFGFHCRKRVSTGYMYLLDLCCIIYFVFTDCRFKSITFYVAEKESFPLGVDEDEFVVRALNHLARSFQQCRDTQTMDAFSLAMQVSFV
jgi:hypothetical protein